MTQCIPNGYTRISQIRGGDMKVKSSVILAILNTIGFLGTIVVNSLANALPINNKTTGELSDQYPNLFVPAGITFSIWGVIYLLLAIFIVYQLITVFNRGRRDSSFIPKIGIWFFIASLANMGWIFAWHYEMVPLSLVIMLLLLGSLIMIYLRLNIGRSDATPMEKFMVHLPFSVYLGWITIATIANLTALLVFAGWSSFGLDDQIWAVIVIVVGIAIAFQILLTRRDIYYCLVVDWALLGILLKRLSVEAVSDEYVLGITIIGLVLVTLAIIIQIIRKEVY